MRHHRHAGVTMPATATRAVQRPLQSAPLGSGQLHQALEDSADIARLHAFCRAYVCTPGSVSSDGKRLDPLKVFDLMRAKGYQVAIPRRPQLQQRKGFTTWLVDVTLPDQTGVRLGFYTPNTS